ncbi:MAG: hypothetical protein DWQ45_12095 [Planctomycetota bacterium]|nr:MAG: hypothetical protein DWQ45_12095 [Planctomycetota bacterium]
MAKDRRSRDQKRKAKLAKREKAKRSRQSSLPATLAYHGDHYKTAKLARTHMETEIAIYEAYVILDRTLLDSDVAAALETLILGLRSGRLPPLSETETVHYAVGEEADFLVENIRRHWALHYQTNWRPPREKRIGVLRTILGTLESKRSPGPRSQSYLRYIAGFLTRKLGVSVQEFASDGRPLPEVEQDSLVALGPPVDP